MWRTLKTSHGRAWAASKDKPRYTRKAPNSYNKEFLQRLFAACDPEDRAVYTFFLRTGCRDQEVMYACWSDLDLVRGTLTIRAQEDLNWTLKDYEERVIPLTSAYVSELRSGGERGPMIVLFSPPGAASQMLIGCGG